MLRRGLLCHLLLRLEEVHVLVDEGRLRLELLIGGELRQGRELRGGELLPLCCSQQSALRRREDWRGGCTSLRFGRLGSSGSRHGDRRHSRGEDGESRGGGGRRKLGGGQDGELDGGAANGNDALERSLSWLMVWSRRTTVEVL